MMWWIWKPSCVHVYMKRRIAWKARGIFIIRVIQKQWKSLRIYRNNPDFAEQTLAMCMGTARPISHLSQANI